MTTVDEFLAELQKAGLADKTLSELKAKKLHELEKEVERLRAENAELREHSDAYKRVCETLGYAEGADGRSGAHYADSKTVCDALKHMKWAQSILEEATYRCIDCGEVFHPTCPTCPPKPGAGT